VAQVSESALFGSRTARRPKRTEFTSTRRSASRTTQQTATDTTGNYRLRRSRIRHVQCTWFEVRGRDCLLRVELEPGVWAAARIRRRPPDLGAPTHDRLGSLALFFFELTMPLRIHSAGLRFSEGAYDRVAEYGVPSEHLKCFTYWVYRDAASAAGNARVLARSLNKAAAPVPGVGRQKDLQ
jgi:hypothetical protein